MDGWKHRDSKSAREALSKLVQAAMRRDGQRAPICVSIPPQANDCDLLLEDVITERDALAREVRDLRRLLFAVIHSAGGEVRVSPRSLLLDRYEIVSEKSGLCDEIVYRVREVPRG